MTLSSPSLKFARAVFGKARRDRWTPWEVHEAEALMEYHRGNKDVQGASRIFKKGMEPFSDEVEYVLRCLGFLISIIDQNRGPCSSVSSYGDLATVHKLEKRIAEVHPQDLLIKRFAERYKYLNIDAIATRDLGFVLHRSGGGSARLNGSSSSGLLGRTDTLLSIVSEAAKQSTATQNSFGAVPESDDLESARNLLKTGYGQTGKRGLRGHIVCPGYIVGDSQAAVTNTDDFL
ncbi:hypothetical protein C8T65DRAFT_739190 [Cerioporus squamosus]|nr:hypothetical protein C8T65DRAFT_739190 [Cerioporus squamosus]